MNEFFQNPRVARAFVALLLSASLALVAGAMRSLKEFVHVGRDVSSVATISVSGEGEAFAVPDVAEFTFSVLKEAKTVPEAQKQSADLNNAILAYLKEAGVEEKDVKMVNYSINPRYEWQEGTKIFCVRAPCPQPPGKQVLIGYEVNQSVSVKVRKVDDAGKLLSGVGEKGATNISGIQFTIDDPDKVQQEARQKAILDAEEKAKILAKDLSVRTVRVVGFSESGGGMPPVLFRTEALGKAMDAAQSVTPQIPIGENKFTSNITIVYEIR